MEFLASWSNQSRDVQHGTWSDELQEGQGGPPTSAVGHQDAFTRRLRRARGAAPLTVEEKMAIQDGFRSERAVGKMRTVDLTSHGMQHGDGLK